MTGTTTSTDAKDSDVRDEAQRMSPQHVVASCH